MKRKTTQFKPKPQLMGLDLKAICSIDHECVGCPVGTKSCCAKYDVCVSDVELNRIIPVLPEAAEYCPHLRTDDGYANVFEEAEKGFHSIDTHDNGLCVFAYEAEGLIRCSLHRVEKNLGLPLGSVKPSVCILYPLTFSEAGDVLTLHDDALGCDCSSYSKNPIEAHIPGFTGDDQAFWRGSFQLRGIGLELGGLTFKLTMDFLKNHEK